MTVEGVRHPSRLAADPRTGSHGVSGNTARDVIVGQPQKTLFTSFEEAGLRWASYFGEIPTPLMFKDTRQVEGNFHHMSRFAEDAAQGLLPEFTLIDPVYFGLPGLEANDDVRRGRPGERNGTRGAHARTRPPRLTGCRAACTGARPPL